MLWIWYIFVPLIALVICWDNRIRWDGHEKRSCTQDGCPACDDNEPWCV